MATCCIVYSMYIQGTCVSGPAPTQDKELLKDDDYYIPSGKKQKKLREENKGHTSSVYTVA